jgi:hypothetical protein
VVTAMAESAQSTGQLDARSRKLTAQRM